MDIRTWSELINFVHAVERKKDILRRIEQTLITQYSHIRYECHLGEIDRVILQNRGNSRRSCQKVCKYQVY